MHTAMMVVWIVIIIVSLAVTIASLIFPDINALRISIPLLVLGVLTIIALNEDL
jgi:hypothetical protein